MLQPHVFDICLGTHSPEICGKLPLVSVKQTVREMFKELVWFMLWYYHKLAHRKSFNSDKQNFVNVDIWCIELLMQHFLTFECSCAKHLGNGWVYENFILASKWSMIHESFEVCWYRSPSVFIQGLGDSKLLRYLDWLQFLCDVFSR